jgi:hypothetical protein
MLVHLDGIERQLATLDARLEQIARSERWASQVQILTRFRGIATLSALGLIAEIGDFARFSHPRELASWLGITPSEYSSGDQQPPRPHHQDRQPPRPPAADRSRLALPPPAPAAEDRPGA